MRVLVTGSGSRYEVGPHGEFTSGDRFKEFLSMLGAAIARRKHQLVILSDDDRHADPHVLTGYAEQSSADSYGTPAVRVSYGSVTDPENQGALKLATFRIQYPSLPLEDFNADGEYPFNRVGIVRDVDVVIVIGGEKGAKEIAEIALALRKAIVPISAFDGVAERIWDRLRRDFERTFDGKIEPLTDYFGRISKERMDGIVRICERMAKLEAGERAMSVRALIYIEVACLIVWFAIFLAVGNADIGIPFMIFSMSTFGIVLRSLVRLQPAIAEPLSAEVFITELGLGIGVAVIYYLLFLIAGSSISTDLQKALQDNHARVSVGVIVSLLSVGVSFLLEDSIAQVSKKLKAATALTSP